MEPVFVCGWNNIEEMKADFWMEPVYEKYPLTDELDGVNILLASYGGSGYEGNAFVLFEKDGKLYEVNGSHCSCYGLEGQWEPEETSVEVLLHRMQHGKLGSDPWKENEFADELLGVLKEYEND